MERLLLRLSLCESDEALCAFVDASLVPVLRALATDSDPAERARATEIVSHLAKRLRPRPDLRVPLAPLAALVAEPSLPAVVANVALIFVDMAARRAPISARAAAVPSLLARVAQRPPAQAEPLLAAFLTALEALAPNALRPLVASGDAAAALGFLRDVLLCCAPGGAGAAASTVVCPGMCPAAMRVVLGRDGARYTATAFAERKVAVARFLTALHAEEEALFGECELFPLALIASCDGNHVVASEGSTLLKRFQRGKGGGRLDLDDPSLVKSLFLLFLGSPRGSDPDTARTPVGHTLRLALCNYLSQSATAANAFPVSIQLVSEALHGSATSPRLRAAGMAFVQWMLRIGDGPQLALATPILLSLVLKVLEDGTAAAAGNSRDAGELKSFSLCAVGLIAKRNPALFCKDVKLLETVFDSASKEVGAIKIAAIDALRSVALAYAPADATTLAIVKALLFGAVRSGNADAQFAAALTANRVFPFGDTFARFLCIACAASSRPDVRDEATRGLSPFVFSKDGDMAAAASDLFPDFVSAVDSITGQLHEYARSGLSPSFSSKAMLEFLWSCLVEQSRKEKRTLGSCLSESPANTLKQLADLTKGSLEGKPQPDLIVFAGKILHELAWFSPQSLATPGFEDWLFSLLERVPEDTRSPFAKVLALLTKGKAAKRLLLLLDRDTLSPAALGFSISAADAELDESIGVQAASALAKIAVNNSQQGKDPRLTVDACRGLGAIGIASKWVGAAEVEALVGLLKSQERSVVEAAVRALGDSFVGNRHPPFESLAIEAIFKHLAESKSEELLFAAGEALCFVALGKAALNYRSPLWPPSLDPEADSCSSSSDLDDEPMRSILGKILQQLSLSQLKRSSGCVWLLALTTHCGRHPLVQANLPGIQESFLALMADNNSLTQESASAGIVAVFERADPAGKDALLRSLFSSVSGNSHAHFGIASEKDVIFAPGALGQLPQGVGQLSTYKELCALASELGKPDLVTKFVSIAANNAAWNGRRGAAYAMTEISSRARDQLLPMLPSLLPPLYRQSFDPNASVGQAMTSVLNALTGGDIRGAVKKHFAAVMPGLISGTNSEQWRVREASVSAMADVAASSLNAEMVSPFVVDMLKSAFRAVDDIKESTRKAGAATLQALFKLVVRLCDPTQTPLEQSKAALSDILPLLVQTLDSRIEDVQALSVSLLKKICHIAGPGLAPFVPGLVETLVQALSSLEPAMLSYVSLRLGAAADSSQSQRMLLDSVRDHFSKSTPISRALEYCIGAVDATNVADLCDRLCALATKTVGLPSRVGVARCATMLCMGPSAEKLVPPFAPALAKSFSASVFDESKAVRLAHSQALAQALRLCSGPAPARSSIQRLCNAYIESPDNEQRRDACGTAFREIVRTLRAERLQAVLPEIVPLVSFGRNDPSSAIKKAFDETFAELPIGGQHQFSDAVISLTAPLLSGSSSWALRKQAADTVASLAREVGPYFSAERVQELVGALVSALGGRTWSGKEAILGALSTVCNACKDSVSSALAADVVVVALRELSRKTPEYRVHAAECLASLVRSFARFDLLSSVLTPLLSELSQPRAEDTAAPAEEGVRPDPAEAASAASEKKKAADISNRITRACLQALHHAWKSASTDSRKGKFSVLASAAARRVPFEELSVQQAALESLLTFFKSAGDDRTLVPELWDAIVAALRSKNERVKLLGLELVSAEHADLLSRNQDVHALVTETALASDTDAVRSKQQDVLQRK